MGRRSRKRMAVEEGRAPAASRAQRDEARSQRAQAVATGEASRRPRAGRPGSGERPPPPWGRFPLTEIAVLAAIVLGVIGVITFDTDSGRTMLLVALALGSLAGLELSIREHFAGYRSHTTLLAAAAAFLTSAIVLVATGGAALGAVLVIAGVVFAAAFWALRHVFRSRSGGLGFR